MREELEKLAMVLKEESVNKKLKKIKKKVKVAQKSQTSSQCGEDDLRIYEVENITESISVALKEEGD